MAKLYFYYSAMNAGKTTTLLQSAYNYHERGMRTVILTPALDNRYGDGVVASRIGLKANGRRFRTDENLLALVEADIAERGPLHCVFIDEAQFLTKAQVWQASDVVDKLNIPVLSRRNDSAAITRWVAACRRQLPAMARMRSSEPSSQAAISGA